MQEMWTIGGISVKSDEAMKLIVWLFEFYQSWAWHIYEFIVQASCAMFFLAIAGALVAAFYTSKRFSTKKFRWIIRCLAILYGLLWAVSTSWDITYPDGELLVKTLLGGGEQFEYSFGMFRVYKDFALIFWFLGFVLGYCLLWFPYCILEWAVLRFANKRKHLILAFIVWSFLFCVLFIASSHFLDRYLRH